MRILFFSLLLTSLYWGCMPENTRMIKVDRGREGITYMSISPSSYNFGTIVAGSVTATQTFTVSVSGNSSAFATGCSAATLVGTYSSAFTIMADTCGTNDIMQNGNCTIDVRANPSYPSGVKLASLSKTCTRGGALTSTLAITTTVTPSIAVTPLTFDFSTASVNETSLTVASFTFTNTGSRNATGCAAPFLGGTNSGDFAITTDNCGVNNLNISSSCTVYVSATPSAVGARTATLSRFCTIGGTTATTANGISVTGVARPRVTLDYSTYDFGRVAVGAQSHHHTLTYSNSGTADATGCGAPTLSGTDSGEFAIVSDACGVADLTAGGNCAVVVRAAPTTSGLKRATLTRTCAVGGTTATSTDSLFVHAKSSYLSFLEAHIDGAAGVDGLMTAREVAITPDQKFVYVASEGDDGVSIFSRNTLTGQLTYVSAFLDNTGGANNLDGANALAMSPDGLFLYVLSNVENALTVFSIAPATGALTYVENHIDNALGVDGLATGTSILVSADGKYVYAAGAGDNGIALFTRNVLTGALTYSTLYQDGVAGVDGLSTVNQITLSGDQATLYSAGTADNAIGVFTRNKLTGALTYSTILQDGVAGVDGVGGILGVHVSPTNAQVFGTGGTDNAVGIFTRDTTTGALTYSTLLQDGVGGVDGLNGARACVMSPDNLFLLATGSGEDEISMMARNPTNSTITYMSVVQDNVGGVDGLAGARNLLAGKEGRHFYATGSTDHGLAVFENNFKRADVFQYEEVYANGGSISGLTGITHVAVSADGLHVYAASATDNSIVAFSRNSATGALTFVEKETDGVAGVDGLDGANFVAVAPDGGHVYVTGLADDAVVVFSRNATTGALTYVETQYDGVASVDGLNGASSVAVSTDNTSVYVTGSIDDSVTAFTRNTTTGALSYVATYTDGASGVDGLDGATFVMTPAAGFVYVVGEGDNAVAIFTRTVATSALSYSTLVQNGVGGVTNMAAPKSFAISSDGTLAYVAAQTSDAVVAFTRSTVTGALTYVANYTDGSGTINGLNGARSVAVMANDKFVVVGSDTDNGIASFALNAATGALRFIEAGLDGISGFDGLNGLTHIAPSPNGNSIYTSAFGEDELGLFSFRPNTIGLVSYQNVAIDGSGGVTGLDGATSVVVSPDGRSVYATGLRDDALVVFSRNAATGALTYVETHVDGALGVDGLDGAISVAISTDGAHVYVASKDENALAVFSRNQNTSALTYVEAHKDGFVLVDGLNSVRDVLVSPDGNHVYAVGYIDDAVAVFTRNQNTGALTYVGVSVNGLAGVLNMDGPNNLVISPDGGFVYVVSSVSESVVVFTRNRNTGVLTYSTSYVEGGGGISGMSFAYSAALSPDGNYMYVLGINDNAVVLFSRNTATGALTYSTTYTDGSAGVTGISSPRKIAISPDGLLAAITGFDDTALAVFARNPADGTLLFIEQKVDGSASVNGLDGASGLCFAPDGLSLYTTGEDDDALSTFVRK